MCCSSEAYLLRSGMIDSRLNYVVAVARSGSFTAAAQAVGVTQSTVTKSVADLERQLGYPLFHRTGRGALATDKGRDFIDRAERILGDTRDLFEGSLSTGDPVSGALRIGACPPSLEWCLAAPVMELLRRHANVRLEISSSSSERMVQQLRHGAVDVAFGYDAVFQEWPDLHREATGELESALFVRKGHPALTQAPAQLSSLMEYDFVCPPDLLPYGRASGAFMRVGVLSGAGSFISLIICQSSKTSSLIQTLLAL